MFWTSFQNVSVQLVVRRRNVAGVSWPATFRENSCSLTEPRVDRVRHAVLRATELWLYLAPPFS